MKNSSHSTYLKKVNTFASFIYRLTNKAITWGEAMSRAHATVKENDCQLIEMESKKGEISKRLISKRLSDFISFTGTGSYNTYEKAVDLAKVVAYEILGLTKSVVISFYNPYKVIA